MVAAVAINTNIPATGSMGKYYASKIGELREVRLPRVARWEKLPQRSSPSPVTACN